MSVSIPTGQPANTVLKDNIIPAASSNFNTDGTSYWGVVDGTRSWDASGFLILNSTAWGFIYKYVGTTNKVFNISVRMKAPSYTGTVRIYWASASAPYILTTGNLTSSWQTFSGDITCNPDNTLYIQVLSGSAQTIHIDDIIIREYNT